MTNKEIEKILNEVQNVIKNSGKISHFAEFENKALMLLQLHELREIRKLVERQYDEGWVQKT